MSDSDASDLFDSNTVEFVDQMTFAPRDSLWMFCFYPNIYYDFEIDKIVV